MSTPEDRAAYIAGMRRLMDILEANPDLCLPDPGNDYPLTIHFSFTVDHRAQLAAWEQAAAVPLEQHLRNYGSNQDTRDGPFLDLDGMLDGLQVRIRARLDQVAERRVLGTRTVEDVEWVRLAAEDPAGSADEDGEPQP